MGEWPTRCLGEVCSFRAGDAFKREEQGQRDGEFPFIKVSDMNRPANETRITEANNWVSEEQVTRLRLHPFPAGASVFAKIGEALKQNRVRRLTRPTVIDNNMMAAMAERSAVDSGFLFHLLRTIDLSRFATGTAVPYLTVSTLNKVLVQVPPLSNQRSIAHALDAYDKLIENNTRRIRILEDLAQAIYREWFAEFRYPGNEDVSLVDSEVGPIPEGWTRHAASDAIDINPTEQTRKDRPRSFFTMADLSETEMFCFPSEKRIAGSGTKFRNGDTLLARITPCLENGKTGFVSSLDEDEVGGGSTEFIVLRGALVGPEFTYLTARSEGFRAHAIKSMSGASGRQRVRNECFDSFPVVVPPPELECTFRNLVRPAFQLVYSLAAEIRVLREARDLLQPRLISGEIDVSSLDDAAKE